MRRIVSRFTLGRRLVGCSRSVTCIYPISISDINLNTFDIVTEHCMTQCSVPRNWQVSPPARYEYTKKIKLPLKKVTNCIVLNFPIITTTQVHVIFSPISCRSNRMGNLQTREKTAVERTVLWFLFRELFCPDKCMRGRDRFFVLKTTYRVHC